MLKSLVESKLSTKLLIIGDTEEASGQDLFSTALRNHIADDSTAKINLVCYEHPFASYLPVLPVGKVLAYDCFTDPCGWSNPSAPKSHFSSFIPHSDNSQLSETTFFIDSLTHLANYLGYCAMYKELFDLKQVAHKIVCLVHCDLLSPDQVEELHFLATAFVTLKRCPDKKTSKERLAEVVYKKLGGKVVKQSETFFLVDELKVMSKVSGIKPKVALSGKKDMENLTTFKLGLQMSEKERKAKDELILPYLKSKRGEIIYEPEADELEEDPDDDLDI